MPAEITTSFWNSQLFSTLLTAVVAVICVLVTHWLTVKSERKKQKTDDITVLKSQIQDLTKTIEEYEATEPSKTGNYLVLKKSGQAICPICWGKERKLVPIYDNGTGNFICGGCHTSGIFDRQKVEMLAADQERENEAFIESSRHLFDNPATW